MTHHNTLCRLVYCALAGILLAASPVHVPIAHMNDVVEHTEAVQEVPVSPCAVVLPVTDPEPSVTATSSATEATPVPAAATSSPMLVPETVATPPPTPRYELVRLNEFFAAPETGAREWIELTLTDRAASVSLQGLRIKDRTGIIFTVATGTLDAEHPFHLLTLSSAKLNNDGDDVVLTDPQNNTVDAVTYEESEKGMSWSRYPDADGEWQSAHPTPTGGNAPPPAPPAPPVVTEEPPVVTEVEPEPVPAYEEETAPEEAAEAPATETSVAEEPAEEPIDPPLTLAKKQKKTQKKSKAVLASAKHPTKISIAMAHEEAYRGIRVELDGVVGSPPGLVTGHGFVLHAPDGRGLLVRVPTSRKLPEFGTKIQINGSLVFQDSGIPYLKLNTKDSWEIRPGEPSPVVPRTIDLLLPAIEDAWGVVAVTGTVRAIRGQTVSIDAPEGSADIAIKHAANYRASRLKIGDTISVTGLLDAPRETARIFPRQPEDIAIVRHAPPPKSTAPPSALPGWTPLGAAGLAIAGTEGFKHVRERRKRRALEKILETTPHSE